MEGSRVKHLERNLIQLGMTEATRALNLMKKEMCAEMGHCRHNGDHYYYHLVDVTQDLLNIGVVYEPCIVASLLHDYIEDVEGVTRKVVADLFGEEVAFYVHLLTKKEGLDYNDPEVMKNYLFQIGLCVWTALIKTADRKHNFSTLRDASFKKRMKQAIETDTYFIPFIKSMRGKYTQYSSYFFSAKTAIEPHLWAIKEYQTEIERLNDIIAEYEYFQQHL